VSVVSIACAGLARGGSARAARQPLTRPRAAARSRVVTVSPSTAIASVNAVRVVTAR
jgi:hypothetical protein